MLELNFESGLGEVIGAKIHNYLLFKSKDTLVHKKEKMLYLQNPVKLQMLNRAIQTSSISSERAFSHGRFEFRGKENMSDQTFMMRMNAREWMKL
eukprot:snap_masked-scaffold_27-processed-gene-0.10-mRNA-1 protein AED:1.00 eAED:1.00 QI:0/0/0/0/1/1/2/0/94